jgi:hypothetical protein
MLLTCKQHLFHSRAWVEPILPTAGRSGVARGGGGFTCDKSTLLVATVAERFIAGIPTAAEGHERLVGGERKGLSLMVEEGDGTFDDQGPVESAADGGHRHFFPRFRDKINVYDR